MPRLELRPTVGAALGPRQTALQPLHVSVGGSLVRVPVGQGECHRHAPVDSDDLARGGTGNRDGDGSERDVPAPDPVAGHTVRPRVRHRTRQPEPDPSELGDQHLGPAAVEGPHVLRPVATIRNPSHCPRLRKPGWPGGERGTGLGELAALLGVSRRPTAWLPPVALLHSQVPHVPGVRAMRQQRCLLGRGRVQAITTHRPSVASDCVTREKGAVVPPQPWPGRHPRGQRPDDLLTGTTGTSRRTPGRGSTGSSTGGPAPAHTGTRRTPPPLSERKMGNEKPPPREGGGHREIRRSLCALRCVPSGERDARHGGRDEATAQVEAVPADAEPAGSLGIRRHVVHRLSA